MHPRKYFTPAEGLKIPDPATGTVMPPHGKWVHASSYWQRRVAEGSGELANSALESVPSPDGEPVTIDRNPR
jgi:hypothetical protein